VELVMRAQIDTIHTNIQETEVILSAAADHNVPLLLASTSEVYGKSQKPGFAENDDLIIGPPHLSRWSYACSKLMDEFLALAYGNEKKLPVTIARLFNTVGPRQTGRYGMVLPRFIESAQKNETLKIFGDGSQTRCFCYVLDTVEALIRLQKCPLAHGEIFNIGSNEEVSIRELAEMVICVIKSKSTLEFVPYEKAYGDGFEDMLRRKPVIEKLRAVTGFAPKTSLEEIIRLTAAAKK
jgi:UDP-glucose 4-epimerase